MTAHPQSWQRFSVPSILKSRACRFSGYLLRERNYISTGILLFPSACFGKLLSPYAFCAAARNLTSCPPDSNCSPSLRNSSSSSRDEKPSPRIIYREYFFSSGSSQRYPKGGTCVQWLTLNPRLMLHSPQML